MTNVIVVHGTMSTPESNWFPYIKTELEKLGCTVFVPMFPTPENQSLKTWLNVFDEYQRYMNKDTILVGHSLGPAFLLNVLERSKSQIKAAFFVSAFTGLLNVPKYDNLNKSFADKKFDYNKIRENCRKFYVINSDNDPFIPLDNGRALAKNLNAEFIILKNAGHINKESGYIKFELLLEKIKSELGS